MLPGYGIILFLGYWFYLKIHKSITKCARWNKHQYFIKSLTEDTMTKIVEIIHFGKVWTFGHWFENETK